MALFSSARERRLWLWTLAVVLAIYSTLALARVLTRSLLESGLLGASFPLVSFLVAMFLVTATVVAHGLKARPGGVQIAVALGVTAAYLLVFLRMAGPEERSHLIEYGVVGVFIYEALTERASHGRRVPAVPVLAILATAAIGLLDECIQVFLPNRVFDPLDILFNLLAATMAVGASVALAWARRWTKDRRSRRHAGPSRKSTWWLGRRPPSVGDRSDPHHAARNLSYRHANRSRSGRSARRLGRMTVDSCNSCNRHRCDGERKLQHPRFPDAGLPHERDRFAPMHEARLEYPPRDDVSVAGGLLSEP